MANISKEKRDKMLGFLEYLKQQHSDEESIIAINEVEAALTEKKYGLVWERHTEYVDEMMKNNIPVFVENKKSEIISNPTLPYNFILEGDNLHSLKLLEKTHKDKVDVIYIDPPYNTGNNFIYDDYMVGDEDSFKHSKWLSFMQRRLIYAQRLLKDTGIIFISINDFEASQIRMLCDEIFGENNFIGQLTWESTTQPTNAGKARFSLQKKVESIYCFSKNKLKKPDFILKEMDGELKYPHIGKFGSCRFEIIEKSDAGTYKRDSMKFPILGQLPREGKRWQIGIETAQQLEREGKIEIIDGIVKKAIYPEDELDKRKFFPFWSHLTADNVGTAQAGKDELNGIIGKAVGFDTVKPTKLIKELLSHFHTDAIILDFFAGSGTTGQAVLELNKEDGGNRKFILCTNNENNICEKVTYQRLKTVITGKRVDDSEYSQGIAANLKYYKTDFVERYPQKDSLSDLLLSHVAEMVQLENAINIDITHILILDEDDADKYINESLVSRQTIYISSDILLSNNQKKLMKDKDIIIQTIPNHYFNFELKEVGE